MSSLTLGWPKRDQRRWDVPWARGDPQRHPRNPRSDVHGTENGPRLQSRPGFPGGLQSVPLAPHPQPDTGVPSRLTSCSELSIFCEGGRCHRKGPMSSRHETLARSASSSPRGETRSDTQGARVRVSLPVLSAGLCRVRPRSPSWVHFGRRTAARRMPPAGRPPRREGDEMSPGSLHGTQERRKRGSWS